MAVNPFKHAELRRTARADIQAWNHKIVTKGGTAVSLPSREISPKRLATLLKSVITKAKALSATGSVTIPKEVDDRLFGELYPAINTLVNSMP